MTAPKLHLSAPDRGAQNVHSGQEVVSGLADTTPDQLQSTNNDVRLGNRLAEFGPADSFEDSVDQRLDRLILPDLLDLRATLLIGIDQPRDQPGAGRIHACYT